MKDNKIIFQDDLITKFLVESPTHGNFIVTIDSEDWDRVKMQKWGIYRDSNSVNTFYVCSKLRKIQKYVRLHRYIMGVTDPKIEIDHIFGDTLDNRKSQLRICTHMENMKNVKRKLDTGIDYHNKRWRARITCNGSQMHLGYFVNKLDAISVYKRKSIEIFGEYLREREAGDRQ
jgi:hypothetical protein